MGITSEHVGSGKGSEKAGILNKDIGSNNPVVKSSQEQEEYSSESSLADHEEQLLDEYNPEDPMAEPGAQGDHEVAKLGGTVKGAGDAEGLGR